jgi:hypothetical protein
MLKISELKEGDLVMAEYDGLWKEGRITDVDRIDEKVEITTVEDQEFWYDVKHIKPILMDESYMFKLGFQKQPGDNGSIKYVKGAFRALLHQPGHFSNFEMWYREDRRHISHPIYVHEFQNNFLDMTKVPLTQGE